MTTEGSFVDREIERHVDWYPYCDTGSEAEAPGPTRDGSIIVVVATDAPLLPHQLGRVAKRPSLALGRLGAVSSDGSGDIFNYPRTRYVQFLAQVPISCDATGLEIDIVCLKGRKLW